MMKKPSLASAVKNAVRGVAAGAVRTKRINLTFSREPPASTSALVGGSRLNEKLAKLHMVWRFCRGGAVENRQKASYQACFLLTDGCIVLLFNHLPLGGPHDGAYPAIQEPAPWRTSTK